MVDNIDHTDADNDQFVSMEHEVLEFWRSHDVFRKVQQQHSSDPCYWYYDGPPFATGLPHHGHLLASTVKDIIPRYFEMKGHKVPRYFGWDCHGVPIEHAIDKDLGLSTQEAVQKLGLAGYNNACRGIVDRYSQQWESTITRIGRWVDFDDCYKTMDTDYMESVWWAVAKLWDKGLIYQGVKVMPYSTALNTSLSNFEASSNYQSVQNPAVTVLIHVPKLDAYLAIWTTTPWTLPANLAVCVGPYTYIKVYDNDKDKYIIIAEDCFARFSKDNNLSIVEQIDAAALVGQSYTPLFDYFSDHSSKNSFTILLDDYVTTADGTGVVHMAPAHGEDDFRVCTKNDISPVCPLDLDGKFTEAAPDFTGQYLKDADKAIISNLKQREHIYKQDVIVHNYPFCPRSDTPLIYLTQPSWFVRVTEVKDTLLAHNNTINWLPEHIKHGRFGKWLENAKDWAISRNRYWGTPIPIWINDSTDKRICIDSIASLEKLCGQKISDLHREHIDNITFSIAGEPGVYKRIPEVLDCWFESGSMPFAQMHYPFENKESFEAVFPADFISEGIDQTRGWFYTLTILSACLFDRPAFKNATVNGIIVAQDGKKMSKRLKNYTPPDILLEKHGADALRLYLIHSNLVRAEEMRFCDDGVIDMRRRILLPWFNAYKFFSTYSGIDGWQPGEQMPVYENVLDQWITSRLHTLVSQVNSQMQAYALHGIVHSICHFLDDLTNTYIRLNRCRFWAEGMEKDKQLAYQCLFEILLTFGKLMAPFTPFLSESIHQKMRSNLLKNNNTHPLSVHMYSYPESSSKSQQLELESAVKVMQSVLILARCQRNDNKIKIKIPLRSLTIIHSDTTLLSSLKPLAATIQRELNVKEILYDTDDTKYIKIHAKLNAPKLGKKLGKDFPKYQQLVQQLSTAALKDFESKGSLTLDSITFRTDDILIFRDALEDSCASSNQDITIALDLNLDEQLIAEGVAREMINRIQKLRKSLDFEVDNRIKVCIDCEQTLQHILTPHIALIQRETLTKDLVFCQLVDENIINIDTHKAQIHLEVITE